MTIAFCGCSGTQTEEGLESTEDILDRGLETMALHRRFAEVSVGVGISSVT